MGQAQLRTTPSHYTVWNLPSRSTCRAGKWGSPAPETSETPNFCQTQQYLVQCLYLRGALAVPPLAGAQHCPTALHTAHTVQELCPSPSPCSASAVGVPVPSFPLCLKEPQPCRHERLFPSPNHHLKATEQLHITVSTPICKASRAVCS